jgi:hypothetical protein
MSAAVLILAFVIAVRAGDLRDALDGIARAIRDARK